MSRSRRDSSKFDEQSGDDAGEGEHGDRDGNNFQPIEGTGFCRFSIHPFFPSSLVLGIRTVIVTQISVESGGFVTFEGCFIGESDHTNE